MIVHWAGKKGILYIFWIYLRKRSYKLMHIAYEWSSIIIGDDSW